MAERFERHRQPWTSDEIQKLHMLARKGMALKAIAKALKRSEESVKDRAKESRNSPWLWGDPSHGRAIQPETLVFLDQEQYRRQVGRTAMTDFRWLWSGDFEPVGISDDGHDFYFAMKAHKPARWVV